MFQTKRSPLGGNQKSENPCLEAGKVKRGGEPCPGGNRVTNGMPRASRKNASKLVFACLAAHVSLIENEPVTCPPAPISLFSSSPLSLSLSHRALGVVGRGDRPLYVRDGGTAAASRGPRGGARGVRFVARAGQQAADELEQARRLGFDVVLGRQLVRLSVRAV